MPVFSQPWIFPSTPFHGLKLTYSVDGAILESQKDTATTDLQERRYSGRAAGTLRVSGFAKVGDRPGRSQARLRVTLFVDDQPVQRFEKSVADNSQVPFSLETVLPSAGRNAQFFVHLSEGGEDGVRVRGTLSLNPKTAVSPLDSLIAIYKARIPKGIASSGPENNMRGVVDARLVSFRCGGYQSRFWTSWTSYVSAPICRSER